MTKTTKYGCQIKSSKTDQNAQTRLQIVVQMNFDDSEHVFAYLSLSMMIGSVDLTYVFTINTY